MATPYQLPSSFLGGMQGASNALSAGKLPQSVQSPLLKQILPTPKPAPVDPNKSPEVFKKRFIEKHGDGVAEDGRNYSQIPAPEIVAKVIRKYGDGNTTDGIPYREFLPRPASPNDSLEYRLSQIESLSQAPKSQFYAPTGTIRGQTEQEKKFTTAVTKRENEGELVKTLKAPYRGLESVGQNLAYGTFGAGADVVDMFGGDKLADKMRKSVEKEKFQSGMLSQNKGLIGGMQSGDLSSVIETLSSGAGYLATGAKIPLYLTALSQGGNLSQEGEEQGQGTLGDKAIAYTTGGISAAIERMSGQKVIGGMMRAGIKKETATTFVQKMNNYLKGLKPSDFEAGTEVIQQGIENIGRSTMGVDYDKGIQQYFEAGLLGKILGKVGDKGFSESPVTVLPPAPPAPSRVDTKNIETLQTIKIGKRANANVESNKSRGFDPYTDIATHQEILPTVDKTGLVRTTEQVQNLEDTLDPINDALTKSIKDEGVLIPLDEFLIDSMNEAKQYENEGASYDRYVNQIRKDFEVYKRFTDAQGRIDLSKINEIKKAKYGISNFSDVESDKANKMVGKAAKELVEKYTKGESTKAINRELARWYSARDLLLAMDGKTVKGGRLGKMAARVGGNIIGSYFGPLGSFAGGEISAAVQGQMMKGSLKTPKGNIDSGDILSKIPKRTTPQLPPASQSSSDKKVELPKQSQPVSVLGLPSQTQAVVPKKEVSGKKVNAPIIQKLAKKQETPKTLEQYNKSLQADDLAKNKAMNAGKTITIQNKKTGVTKTYEYDKDPAGYDMAELTVEGGLAKKVDTPKTPNEIQSLENEIKLKEQYIKFLGENPKKGSIAYDEKTQQIGEMGALKDRLDYLKSKTPQVEGKTKKAQALSQKSEVKYSKPDSLVQEAKKYKGLFSDFKEKIDDIKLGGYKNIDGDFYAKDSDGVVYINLGERNPNKYKPTENIDMKGYENKSRDNLDFSDRNVFVDGSNILDGHHRWLRAKTEGKSINVYKAIDIKKEFQKGHIGNMELPFSKDEWIKRLEDVGGNVENTITRFKESGIKTIVFKDGEYKLLDIYNKANKK